MAENLDLGYDLFDSVMRSREVQAENMAKRLMEFAGPTFGTMVLRNVGEKPGHCNEVGKAYEIISCI